MNVDWLLFAVALLAGLAPLLKVGTPYRGLRKLSLIAGVLTLAGAAALSHQINRRAEGRVERQKTLPREGRPGGYVSSDSCQACHPREYQTWHRSYHRTMTQYANPSSVKANFHNLELE